MQVGSGYTPLGNFTGYFPRLDERLTLAHRLSRYRYIHIPDTGDSLARQVMQMAEPLPKTLLELSDDDIYRLVYELSEEERQSRFRRLWLNFRLACNDETDIVYFTPFRFWYHFDSPAEAVMFKIRQKDC